MSETTFHPASRHRLQALAADLPHAVLLTGPQGIGLEEAVRLLAEESRAVLITIQPERAGRIDQENGTIPVEQIRELYDLAKTVEPGRRLIAINQAETMGIQAQNAFLKLLEEPNASTHFVLLSSHPARLLPTIRSRVQTVELRPITQDQSERLLDELNVKTDEKRAQLLFMAQGLPSELRRLAADSAYFDQRVQVVRDARQFLQGTPYDRLRLAQAYKDDRARALALLADALSILRKSLTGKSDAAHISRLEALLDAYERIAANGNIRLQLAAVL